MDSSNESFAWSDASSDSDAMAFDIKQEQNDEESESSYKRNIQEKSLRNETHEHKKKAKKRKHEESTEVNGDYHYKHIKSEPESDLDITRNKKNKKYDNITENEEMQDPLDHDDSYLNYRVKLEQESFKEPAQVKSKKKKRHKRDSEVASSEDYDLKTPDKKICTYGSVEDIKIDKSHVKEEDVDVKKKKKKKRKTDTITSNDDFENSDDNFQAKKIKLKKKKKHDDKTNRENYDDNNVSQVEDISCINNSMPYDNYIDDDQIMKESIGYVNNVSTDMEPSNTNDQERSLNKSLNEIPKISDRLRFEDEDSTKSEPKEYVDVNLSKYLKKYMNANKNLTLKSCKLESGNVLAEDDEIWIIKGPSELDIKDFKDINIKLDTTTKLKFNGKTYELLYDNCIQKAPILSYNKNKLYVKNVPVKGLINLRKKIPKAHIPEENIMINNQINFIPLPETKCRHPLFGVNYKKATKISSSVAERLNESQNKSTTIDNERKKRKKHKKEKRKIEIQSEPETKSLDVIIPVISSKKKRKRESSGKEENPHKKSKHMKHEPESTDVWESEQAIEKNLFDF